MTPSQRKIKAFSNTLAIVLIVVIFVTVAIATFLLSGGISLTNTIFDKSPVAEFSQTYENVESLEVDLDYSELKIATGESFAVHATNIDAVKVIFEDNTLHIEDVSNLVDSIKNKNIVTVYMPAETVLKSCKLDSDLANITVDSIVCEKFKLDLENGTGFINYVEATESAKIESGTGAFTINSSQLSNLSLETGVGAVTIHGNMTGNAKIETGLGKLDLLLSGSIVDYTINGKTGAGNFIVADNEVNGAFNFEGGSDMIAITGGIGAVNIRFENQ